MIEAITADAEIGQQYEGTVKRIMPFGAFVEILPGKEGLLHISELDHKRVESVEDVVEEGGRIAVKVLEIDNSGKIRLSHKATLDKPNNRRNREGTPKETADRVRRTATCSSVLTRLPLRLSVR